jgi:DNA-binding NtrC family response regulator
VTDNPKALKDRDSLDTLLLPPKPRRAEPFNGRKLTHWQVDKMDNTSIKVLLVEGDVRFARTLRDSLTSLTSARIDLQASENLAEALRRFSQTRFDAILLDLDLPDSRGLATFVRVQRQAPKVPIVVLAGYDNERQALDAVRQGAQDYLIRSKADGKILSRVIRHAIERKRLERRLAAQHAVTRVLAESATLSEATPRILQAICESLEWEMGALWKVDAQANGSDTVV